jgi:glutamate dehydrogenase (NAD(P)+)
VTASYFEWVQNMQSLLWTEAEVNAKLEAVMKRAFTEVYEASRKNRTHMRTGAYILAVGRVADATLVRGLFP